MTASFFSNDSTVFLLLSNRAPSSDEITRLEWLLEAKPLGTDRVAGPVLGPRKEMVTPWSTNATEIAANIGVLEITRMEEFAKVPSFDAPHDRMLQTVYKELDAGTLVIDQAPKKAFPVENLEAYNREQGLALSDEEISYLKQAAVHLKRPLTDTEVYAFGQINSEHCRHKIFRGEFVIDGKPMPSSLFDLIRETSKRAPENIVSAYSDNVAFIKGPPISEFVPTSPDRPSEFTRFPAETVLSLKAETHNFPTTVEPFNGGSTGSGGEIRDRLAGGQGSIPLSGAAVYMTAYPRLKGSRRKPWEEKLQPRKWRYQTPEEILIKASDGASDFGNKFGQPLLVGSLLTFEASVDGEITAYDRAVMLAGGVGYAHAEYSHKRDVQPGDKIILLGGDNYRIGMSGAAASSIDTGVQSQELELSAIQRANAEMQKRVANVIRSLAERPNNPIKTIHDHGAGGHMNCFTELLEKTGGRVEIDALPIGDPTLSPTEILCNESQERMGLIVAAEDVELLRRIAERERAPIYVVGEVTGTGQIEFVYKSGEKPVSLPKEVLLGSSPKMVLDGETVPAGEPALQLSIKDEKSFREHLLNVLSLEAVACKDWLTNKVDRCVTAKIAQQQCVGPLQLPLSGYSISALDYGSHKGIVTSLGHAPGAGLISPEAGSRLSIAEALTNLVFAPLEKGLSSLVLSANWMWPARQPGENSRLYRAVQACSEFAIQLGIAIPTGKDSMSMTMKYRDGKPVKAPGVVVITAAGATDDFTLRVTPELKPVPSTLLYISLSGSKSYRLGGGSLAQTLGALGNAAPDVGDAEYFKRGFEAIQKLVREEAIVAGHDVSSGGLITTLVEMAIVGDTGCRISISESDVTGMLFAEEPAVVLQVEAAKIERALKILADAKIEAQPLGEVAGTTFSLKTGSFTFEEELKTLRKVWFEPSFLLDQKQTAKAGERFETISTRHLKYTFPTGFTGQPGDHGISFERTAHGKEGKARAAVIRDKGTNGDREMAFSLYAAGFEVVDVMMSDLVAGRENLENVQLVSFPGGFSNSDVLGAGKGWAGMFRYNDRAMQAIRSFMARPDTLMLGVCNGCQLVGALELLYPEHKQKLRLQRNASKKFESSFLSVEIGDTDNVFLKPLSGTRLGIWVAHGEGRFEFPEGESAYKIPMRYTASTYPENPNGSPYNAAGVSSPDGRSLIMMPHLERSIFPWNWGYYPRKGDEISPWMLSFRSAYDWCVGHRG